MLLKFLAKYRDAGLLVMRIGLGVCFFLHGLLKLMGGREKLAGVGSAMDLIGIPGSPQFWGIVAAVTESFGGILLIVGLACRPICLVLTFTMVMATADLYFNAKMRTLADFSQVSHPLKMAFVFLGLAFVGPGRFSVDKD